MRFSLTYGCILVLLSVLPITSASAAAGEYPIRPVPFTWVSLQDAFWAPRLETNRKITIPYAFQKCEETGRIDNFAVAGKLKKGKFEGIYFNDSDVFKVIEGAAYALANYRDPELEKYVDDVIVKIAAAQEPDGYLYTARTLMRPDKMPPGGKERWSHIAHGHELYNVGHLYEAAVAYHQATGKRKLLDVALKNADLIDRVFGPGKKAYPPGHQEIEIGLAKLYRTTQNEKYLRLAKFFLDQRGRPEGHKLYGAYCQDHKPVIDQEEAVGHAVRAAYLYAGMADIAALTGDSAYITAIRRLWRDVAGTKLYITGGIGATGGNEGFGDPYVLPNDTAYCETCASIANALWNHRLFLLSGEAKYLDVLERVIYNGFLSGISLRGDRFFYPNRLESPKGASRSPWFSCACCPANIVRFLPSIPGYAYAFDQNSVYVNLFIQGTADLKLPGRHIRLSQQTRYPWQGRVKISVQPDKPNQTWTLKIRLPGWSRQVPVESDLYKYLDRIDTPAKLTLNQKSFPLILDKGYAVITRPWASGDVVELDLPMPVRRVIAHDKVRADRGRVALERGPVVYCAEGIDQPTGRVRNLLLPDDQPLSHEFRPDLLNGVEVLTARAWPVRHLDGTPQRQTDPVAFTAIPYYAWCHRGKTPMAVWLARDLSAAQPPSASKN